MDSILMDRPKTVPWINEAKKYIDDHLTDPNLSLKQISYHFSMNPVQFRRMFKEEAGEKFVDYVTRLHIELSMQKLAMSSDFIQEIAWQVGYTRIVSFV